MSEEEGKTEDQMDREYTFTQGVIAGLLIGIRLEKLLSDPSYQRRLGQRLGFPLDARIIRGGDGSPSIMVTPEETAEVSQHVAHDLKGLFLGKQAPRFPDGIPGEVIDYGDSVMEGLSVECPGLL